MVTSVCLLYISSYMSALSLCTSDLSLYVSHPSLCTSLTTSSAAMVMVPDLLIQPAWTWSDKTDEHEKARSAQLSSCTLELEEVTSNVRKVGLWPDDMWHWACHHVMGKSAQSNSTLTRRLTAVSTQHFRDFQSFCRLFHVNVICYMMLFVYINHA